MRPTGSRVRRACDRCHAQKLRCPRDDGNSKESCSRCSKAGVLYVYSPPQPTGRPATHPCGTEKDTITSTQTSYGSALPVNSTSWDLMNVLNPSNLSPPINSFSSEPWDSQVPGLENVLDPNVDLSQVLDPEFSKELDVDPAGLSRHNSFSYVSPSSSHQNTAEDASSAPVLKLWPPPNADAAEVCIKQLSEISLRLHPVYRTSCMFENAQKANPGSLLSSTAFSTVTYFLQEKNISDTTASHGCKALFEIFQSSRCLLDVIHQVQAMATRKAKATTGSEAHQPIPSAMGAIDEGSAHTRDSSYRGLGMSSTSDLSFQWSSSLATPTHSSITANNAPKDVPASQPYSGKMACPVISKTGKSSGPDGVTLYLILACYIRLLQIYQTLIAALLQDALYLTESVHESVPSFFELRLVLFVQLIAHLLNRLKQAVAGFSCQSGSAAGCTAWSMNPSRHDQASVVQDEDEGLGNAARLESIIAGDLQQLQRRLQSV